VDTNRPDPISELTDDPKILKEMLRDLTRRLSEKDQP